MDPAAGVEAGVPGFLPPAQKFHPQLPIPDTRSTEMTTSRVLEEVMKGMIRKATEVLTATAGLYREMTVSALRLVPRRD